MRHMYMHMYMYVNCHMWRYRIAYVGRVGGVGTGPNSRTEHEQSYVRYYVSPPVCFRTPLERDTRSSDLCDS